MPPPPLEPPGPCRTRRSPCRPHGGSSCPPLPEAGRWPTSGAALSCQTIRTATCCRTAACRASAAGQSCARPCEGTRLDPLCHVVGTRAAKTRDTRPRTGGSSGERRARGAGAPFGATSTLRGLVRTASAQRCDSTPRAGADVTPFTLWISYHQKPNPAPQPAGLSGDRRGSGIGVQVSCPSQRGCLCRGRGTSQTTPIRSHCAGVNHFPSKSPLKHVPPATRLLFPLLNPGACRWKLLCGALSPHTWGDRGRGGAAPSVCTAVLPCQTRAGSISHRRAGDATRPSSDGLPC